MGGRHRRGMCGRFETGGLLVRGFRGDRGYDGTKDAGLLGIPDWRQACQDRAACRKTCDEAVGLQTL